jgi:hypothetical protein
MMGTPRSNNRAALSDNLRRIFALMSDTPCRRPWPLSVIVELVERNSRLAGTIYEGCSKESDVMTSSAAIPLSCSMLKNALMKATITSKIAKIALIAAKKCGMVQQYEALAQARNVCLEMCPGCVVSGNRVQHLRSVDDAVHSQ